MIKDLLYSAGSVVLYKKGVATPLDDWQQLLSDIFDYAYVSPSFKEVSPTNAHELTKDGIWLEFNMDQMVNHEDYNFEKLLISIKPKYTWLTCIRYYDETYQGKCFNINLSSNTTQLYKYLNSL